MSEAQVEVVKWYTKARKFPQLIGRTPDGNRIPGGPYTSTQATGAALVLAAAKFFSGLWAHFGLFTNLVLVLVVLAATVIGLGRLPIGARNPALALWGVVKACFAPAHGRLGVAVFRLPLPAKQLRPSTNPLAPVLAKLAQHRATRPSARPARPVKPARAAAAASVAPAVAATAPPVALSSVQQLLVGADES